MDLFNEIRKDKVKNDLEISIKQGTQQEIIFIDTLRPHPGHTMFEYNYKENVLRPANYVQKRIHWEDVQKVLKNRDILIEENCIYFSRLNKNNAIEFLKKEFGVAPIYKEADHQVQIRTMEMINLKQTKTQ